jgi:hypothetical protein
VSAPSNMNAPVGLLDAPYDLDRILDFWLSLPNAARDPWWPKSDEANYTKAAQAVIEALRAGTASFEELAEAHPDLEDQLSNIAGFDSGEQNDAARIIVDVFGSGRSKSVPKGGGTQEPWSRLGHEIMEILFWADTTRFTPSRHGFEFQSRALRGAGDHLWSDVEAGSKRIQDACRKRALSASHSYTFSLWLSSFERLTVKSTDDDRIRTAKDVLWQVVAPRPIDAEVIHRGAKADLVVTLDPSETTAQGIVGRGRDGVFFASPAPAVKIRAMGPKLKSEFALVAAPEWCRGAETMFADGYCYAIMCGPIGSPKKVDLVQTGLGRRIRSHSSSVRIAHPPAWQKQGGVNDILAAAWLAAVRSVGLSLDGGAVVYGDFEPRTRTFRGDIATVRKNILLETAVRSAFEHKRHLDLLTALAPPAGAIVGKAMGA